MDNRTKGFILFCAPIAVVMAFMFLPLLLLLLFAQAIYELSLLILNAVLPSSLNTIAFGYGAEMLSSGIGLMFTWIFILARYLVDLILRFKIFFNFVMIGCVSWYYYVDGFVFSNPFHTIKSFYDWFNFGSDGLSFFQNIEFFVGCFLVGLVISIIKEF